jgi:hypothetical protein
MKYFQQSVDFDYSWEEVSTSNWQKYGPWNEKTPHVIAVDTLSRSVDASTGIVSDSHHMSSEASTNSILDTTNASTSNANSLLTSHQ